MHIQTKTESLQQYLELVGRVSTKHVTLPVLQCVLFKADESLVLKATNLEIGVEATVPATIEEKGEIAVPAQTLLQTVSLHSDRDITLRAEDGGLVVEGGGSTTFIKAIPHDEFPKIPQVKGEGQEIHADNFARGVRDTAFAASQSSIKPELGSVCVFQKKEHTLTFVATDSFRLVEKTVTQKNVVLDGQVLIPYKNALEITKIFDTLSGDAVMALDENQISFTFEHVYVVSRLVAGSFPDYERVIPKEYNAHSTVLKQDLLHTLRKTQIFLNNFAQVTVTVEDNHFTASTNNGNVGTTTEAIHAKNEGENVSLNFNQRYLTDPLSHITDDSVVLHFGVDRKMLLEGVSDTSFRYLVMPMNK